jgi:hypothetical protein
MIQICIGLQKFSVRKKLQIRKSQKTCGPQIENPQIASFAEGPQIKKRI